MRRGSATIRRVRPEATAWRIRMPITGWHSVVLEPMTKMSEVSRKLRNGVRHGSAAEGHGKPRDRGGVTQPGAVVHVVRAEAGAHQLLHDVVVLVGCLCRGEPGKGVRAPGPP